MEFIKYLDLFNIKFSFYTNNQPYNQSIFGGIMTIIYLITCILIFFISGYDDKERESYIEEIDKTYEILKNNIECK